MVRVAILGCGTMGLKIAGRDRERERSPLVIVDRSGTFAASNHLVKIFDSDLKQLDSLHQRIHHDEDQLYRDGLTINPTFPVSSLRSSSSSFLDLSFFVRDKFFV